jgi:hypothetical protein
MILDDFTELYQCFPAFGRAFRHVSPLFRYAFAYPGAYPGLFGTPGAVLTPSAYRS